MGQAVEITRTEQSAAELRSAAAKTGDPSQARHLAYHTFLRPGKTGPEDVLRDQTKRLEYLRGKLLDDVATGDKTFVV